MTDYARYKKLLGERALPCALVDLDALDRNIAVVREAAAGKAVRVASKSVRHLGLLRYIAQRLGSQTLMSYAAREAAFLVGEGFNDILLAYPTANPSDATTLAVANQKANVRVAVDEPEHLAALSAAALKNGVTLPVVVDIDVSLKKLGLHIGVRRSPLHAVEQVAAFAERCANTPGLRFAGLLAYEAHIAGLTDANPFSRAVNGAKYAIKKISRGPLEKQRAAIAEAVKKRGLPLELFNGGGSGSLRWCSHEAALTEVTAGSAFLTGHLFDYYRDIQFSPALFFALQVVRVPMAGLVTCHGGGFVASGEIGRDRLPRPALPEGLRLLDLEGAGEVQTPLSGARDLHIGDPVFFRHAKAGELAEHFNSYVLVRGETMVEESPTYRGLGHAFL